MTKYILRFVWGISLGYVFMGTILDLILGAKFPSVFWDYVFLLYCSIYGVYIHLTREYE